MPSITGPFCRFTGMWSEKKAQYSLLKVDLYHIFMVTTLRLFIIESNFCHILCLTLLFLICLFEKLDKWCNLMGQWLLVVTNKHVAAYSLSH